MSPEEFLEKVRAAVFHMPAVFFYYEKKQKNRFGCMYDKCRSKKEALTLDDFVKIEWVTGGVTGGSCWDDGGGPDPHESFGGEIEPEFEALDKILTSLSPEISFLKYKAIINACVKIDDRTENEYYGNYTTFRTKKVVLRDLYEKMQELSLI